MKKIRQSDADLEPKLITHFRAYALQHTASGTRMLGVRIGAIPGPPLVKELVSGDDVIVPDEIRAWGARLSFPLNDGDVATLVAALNLMLDTVYAVDAVPFHREAAMQRLIKHIEGLVQELPTLIEDGRNLGFPGAGPVLAAFEKLLSAAQKASEWVKIRAANWGSEIKPRRRGSPWHDDAACLAFILEVAAARAGKLVSFTKPTAPAVAFIDSALNRASVKHGSREAIARAMARRKRKIERAVPRQESGPAKKV